MTEGEEPEEEGRQPKGAAWLTNWHSSGWVVVSTLTKTDKPVQQVTVAGATMTLYRRQVSLLNAGEKPT